MPHDSSSPLWQLWKHKASSLSAKLVLSLVASMIVVFGLLGYFNIRLHRQHLEQSTLASAERVSDVIKRSTTYYMLRNDREGLYHVMHTIGDEPGMERVRIFDQQGQISYSTDPTELNHVVDKRAEACYGCHSQTQPLAKLNRPDRFRIYRNAGGQRVLASSVLSRTSPPARMQIVTRILRASKCLEYWTQISLWRKPIPNLRRARTGCWLTRLRE